MIIGNPALSAPENAVYDGSIMSGFLSDRALKSGKWYTNDLKLSFEGGYRHSQYLEIPPVIKIAPRDVKTIWTSYFFR
jgi:hypothetical protein